MPIFSQIRQTSSQFAGKCVFYTEGITSSNVSAGLSADNDPHSFLCLNDEIRDMESVSPSGSEAQDMQVEAWILTSRYCNASAWSRRSDIVGMKKRTYSIPKRLLPYAEEGLALLF
ncbi:hypothetical protein WQ54_27470 [Bacillus sp. SA1-12]|nr:hypothetical protein WQ54_27470 [Bacillus sp. SA1-12]